MKKIFGLGLALATIVIATSCEEEVKQPASLASFIVVHASPTSAVSGAIDTIHVFQDEGRLTPLPGILYLANSIGPYLPIMSGSHTISIRRKNVETSDLYVTPFTYDFAAGGTGAYTFFVYDTTTSATGQAKILKLTDNLTLPATTPVAQAKVRFLHLAPNQGAVDVTYLRTSVTPNDSVTVTGKTYVGATPDEAGLSAFASIPKGAYTVKVKTAGTQTVLTSLSLTTAAQINGVDVTQGPIYSFFISGTAKGRPLALRSLKHY